MIALLRLDFCATFLLGLSFVSLADLAMFLMCHFSKTVCVQLFEITSDILCAVVFRMFAVLCLFLAALMVVLAHRFESSLWFV